MKALTVLQPWASLIAWGVKGIETRDWRTSYRGEIAIHAGLSKRELWGCPEGQNELRRLGMSVVGLPLGRVVAVATLLECKLMDAGYVSRVERTMPLEFECGYFAVGRYAWLLGDVRRLERPVVVKGAQGIWEWDVQGCELGVV